MKALGDNLGKLLGLIVGHYLAFFSDEAMTGGLFFSYLLFFPVAVGCAIDVLWTNRNNRGK